MKIKKLTPLNVAPVKRENLATVSQEANANAIAPYEFGRWVPFAGDDAE